MKAFIMSFFCALLLVINVIYHTTHPSANQIGRSVLDSDEFKRNYAEATIKANFQREQAESKRIMDGIQNTSKELDRLATIKRDLEARNYSIKEAAERQQKNTEKLRLKMSGWPTNPATPQTPSLKATPKLAEREEIPPAPPTPTVVIIQEPAPPPQVIVVRDPAPSPTTIVVQPPAPDPAAEKAARRAALDAATNRALGLGLSMEREAQLRSLARELKK